MIVTHKIDLDMKQSGDMHRLEAVQDDRYTRDVELTLTAGGEDWIIPETASVVVRYRKSDGLGGQYDALPDGTQAWSASGNVLRVAVAPQVLTVPGPVTVSVGFLDGKQEINTFCFLINVRANAGAEVSESEPYFYVRGFLPQPDAAAAGQFLQITGVNSFGAVTQVTAVDAPIGEQGEAGATFTPAVAQDGTLTWTNDKGLENPDPVNIRGPQGENGAAGPQGEQGEQGPQGEQGDSAVLTIMYQVSSSKYQSGLDHSAWSATIPTMTETNKYLWAKIEITTGALCVEKYGILGVYGETGPQGPQGIQGETGPQGVQGPQGETGRTPGLWLAPEDDSAFILQYGVNMSHMVGTVEASADTVFAGDMILCSDGGVVLVQGFSEKYSGWVLCQGAKDEADLEAGAAVKLKGADGTDGNRIWLVPNMTSEEATLDFIYFSGLVGGVTPDENTVHAGDMLVCKDGCLLFVDKVELFGSNYIVLTTKGGDTVLNLTGPAGATGATPALTIGTVETGEPGTDAVAIITGTAENPVLSLRIPRGADGAGGGGASTTVVTVGFYGTDFVCDGVDDDVEILAAINALPDSGGTVKLAAGDYHLNSTIAISKNNVRIVGEVNSTTQYLSAKPSVNLHGSKTIFNPTGWNVQISELSFLGERAVTGLNLQNAAGSIRVERCFFSGWYEGINAAGYSDSKDVTIRGCAVTDCTYGIRNPKNTTVIGCVISGGDYGIYGPIGCGIHGNSILDCGTGIGPIDNGKNTITGNTIKRGNGTAADYAGEQHTILLGQLDLDNTTMLYGYHNCITGNFLHGKDVTIKETTGEAALAELGSCIISDNLAGTGGGGNGKTAILPEMVVTDVPVTVPLSGDLCVGKVYEVIFDGVSYEVACKSVTAVTGVPALVLGNTGSMGLEDAGEPFFIGQVVLDGTLVTMAAGLIETGTTAKLAIYELDTIPYFDLTAMGLPALSMDSPATVSGVDLTEVFNAMEKGPIKIQFQANVGIVVNVQTVICPTQIVGSGQCGSTVLLFLDGSLLALEVTFNDTGLIYVGAKIVIGA